MTAGRVTGARGGGGTVAQGADGPARRPRPRGAVECGGKGSKNTPAASLESSGRVTGERGARSGPRPEPGRTVEHSGECTST